MERGNPLFHVGEQSRLMCSDMSAGGFGYPGVCVDVGDCHVVWFATASRTTPRHDVTPIPQFPNFLYTLYPYTLYPYTLYPPYTPHSPIPLHPPLQLHHIFHMHCMREHIDGLNHFDQVLFAEDRQVAGLGRRITAYIHDTGWRHF